MTFCFNYQDFLGLNATYYRELSKNSQKFYTFAPKFNLYNLESYGKSQST